LDSLAGPFDYVLNDADKENCDTYIKQLLPKLVPGAAVLTDNTMSHPEELAPFLEWVRTHDAFASAHVPVGNGMELSVYLGD
jgi:predicted O-methyltransferase YrrM